MDMESYLRLSGVCERDRFAYISVCEGVWWVAKDAVEAGEGVVVFVLCNAASIPTTLCWPSAGGAQGLRV